MGTRVVDLFSGIGGFSLGFERAGFRIVAHVEKDANCRKLLAAKWPDAVLLDDARTAGKHNLPECDVVTFGFPCQDLSVDGKRAGLSGERSGLFYEATRIIRELQPAWTLFENVPGLLSSGRGRDFGLVLNEMGKCGYRGAWRIMDAQWIGVAQRRRRVFGLFTRLDSGAERAAEVLSIAESLRGHPAPSREAGEGVAGTLESRAGGGGFPGTDGTCSGHVVAFSCKDYGADAGELAPTMRAMNHAASHANGGGQIAVAHTDVAHTLLGEGFDASEDGTGRGTPLVPTIVPSGMAVRRLTPIEAERLQGFPDGYTAGFSDSCRYRMLGNAVCQTVSYWIALRLMAEIRRDKQS
jgi:DNA (cytosine-5)-methyltransferase 1